MSTMQNAADGDETYSHTLDFPDEPSTEMVQAPEEGAYTTPLLDEPIWLCYRLEGDSTRRKVPKAARPDGRIENIDPTKDAGSDGLTDYYSALQAIKESKGGGDFDDSLDGVGLTLGELPDGRTLAGIDIDDAIVDGEMCEFARTLVNEMDTYAERSVSGDGLHLLFYGDLDDELANRTDIDADIPAHLEMYDEKRYFTVTGRKLACAPETVEERGETARAFHRAWFDERDAEPDSGGTSEITDTDTEPTESGLTTEDAKLLAKIRSADDSFQPLWEGRIGGYQSHSEADLALASKLSYWCRIRGETDRDRVLRLFNASALGAREKWRDRRDYRRRTLDKAHMTFD
jgi:primase-polymerase (primpol)-like protein